MIYTEYRFHVEFVEKAKEDTYFDIALDSMIEDRKFSVSFDIQRQGNGETSIVEGVTSSEETAEEANAFLIEILTGHGYEVIVE